MWTYAPKVNRVIKTPSSMMNQNWMGSDFSNKDISRSTDILNYYTYRLDNVNEVDGMTTYTISAIPKEEAPVVWGKEVLVIRSDHVIASQEFWDQDNKLVKVMTASNFTSIDGRNVAKTMRMFKVASPEEYTEVITESMAFNVTLPNNTFTLSNLRNPRR